MGEDVTFNLRPRPQLSLMWSGVIESESLVDRATEACPSLALLPVSRRRAQSAPQALHAASRAQSVSDQLSFLSSVLLPNYSNSYTQVLQWGTKPFWIVSLIYRDCSTNLPLRQTDDWESNESTESASIQAKGQREGISMLPTHDSHFNTVCLMNLLSLWSGLLHNAYRVHIYCGLHQLTCTLPPSTRSSRHCNLSPVPQE